jgi:hypothetical protein
MYSYILLQLREVQSFLGGSNLGVIAWTKMWILKFYIQTLGSLADMTLLEALSPRMESITLNINEVFICLWTPPPGAADIVGEEIRKARTKRQDSPHIFICPRLLTPYWRTHLHRSADLVFEIPAGSDYWPQEMHEPLILAIFCLSYHIDLGNYVRVHQCWNWETGCNVCGELVTTPKGLFCSNFGSKQGPWEVCHQAWCSKCYTASESLAFHVKEARNEAGAVWRRKKDKARFMVARDGDMWSCPFQCNFCWFVNLEGRLPNEENRVDERLMGYIHQVNLDVMWSREEGTVKGTMAQLSKAMRMCDDLGMEKLELPVEAWPVGDNMGFRLAITMLHASQGKGRNDNN